MKTVALFVPCFIDAIYPKVALATAKLLKESGFIVKYPKNQTCCGQPFFNSGYTDEAKELAKKFYEIFKSYDYIVAPSASCVSMVKVHYEKLLDERSFKEISNKTYEIVEFLQQVCKGLPVGITSTIGWARRSRMRLHS
jgi:L-lactate dehydrogenase complex protein LldE